MGDSEELYQKEKDELVTEINVKTQSWFKKLKAQANSTRIDM
jgi:hypothetical protein